MELRTADGQLIDITAGEQAFHAAMAAPEPDEAPDYPAPPRRDPEAPYGYKDDGTPKKAPGRPRKDPDAKARAGRSPAPAPPRPQAAGKATPARPGVDRKAGVDGVLQITAGVLIAFPGTRADAAAVAEHAPALSSAVVATADADDRFARALDKLLTAGPYAALVMAVVPLTAQIAANHGWLPAGMLGTQDPAVLRASVEKSLAPAEAPAAA